ncbi:MAG: hypothetical protein NT038_01105 [Euryarchaeota archaeon]|nr:hypothetical protein [Euryarchaeota archaeon]
MVEDKTLHRLEQCYFCDINKGFELMRQIYNYNVKFFGTYSNFYVLPMIGAGIDGYILVFHKDHHHSLADIPLSDIKSLRKLIGIIKNEIRKSHGPSIVFEHGSTCDNISCLVDHAHLHIAPVPEGFDLVDEIERDYKLTPMRKYTDLKYWCHGGLGKLQYSITDDKIDRKTAKNRFSPFSGYLYYENSSGKMFIHELKTLKTFQPQYLRIVLLKKLGKEHWEWNKNLDHECQRRTIENLQGLSKYLTPIKNIGGQQ